MWKYKALHVNTKVWYSHCTQAQCMNEFTFHHMTLRSIWTRKIEIEIKNLYCHCTSLYNELWKAAPVQCKNKKKTHSTHQLNKWINTKYHKNSSPHSIRHYGEENIFQCSYGQTWKKVVYCFVLDCGLGTCSNIIHNKYNVIKSVTFCQQSQAPNWMYSAAGNLILP